VLVNNLLIPSQINAKSLVVRDIAFDPLDVGPELLQGRVRFLRGLAQRLSLGAADSGQLAFDDEFAHRSSRAKVAGS
jgi:hypothetical protein